MDGCIATSWAESVAAIEGSPTSGGVGVDARAWPDKVARAAATDLGSVSLRALIRPGLNEMIDGAYDYRRCISVG